MTPELADLLERTNPWRAEPARLTRLARRNLPQNWVPRRVEGALRGEPGESTVQVLAGPRGAGKRSVAWAHLTAEPAPLLAIPCGHVLVQEWAAEPERVIADLQALVPARGRVLLEDVHALPGAADLLGALAAAALQRPVWATASTALTGLSPAVAQLPVWPLSLAEIAAPMRGEPPALQAQRRSRAVDGLLLFGGYPQAWTTADPEPVLGERVAAVLREASERFAMGHPRAFRQLLSHAAGQVGRAVNHSEWARVLGIASATVSEYLGILERVGVLRRVAPFVGGRRAELTKAPLLFFVDNGLRNALRGGFAEPARRTDLDALALNLVFGEVVKRFEGQLRCWRTSNGAQVPFVLELPPGVRVGLAVKATAEARPRLPRGCRSFIQAYQPAEFWLVTRGSAFEERLGLTLVRGVPLSRLPETLDVLL